MKRHRATNGLVSVGVYARRKFCRKTPSRRPCKQETITIYNPNFKPVEFDGFRKQAGLNSLSRKTMKSNNPFLK